MTTFLLCLVILIFMGRFLEGQTAFLDRYLIGKGEDQDYEEDEEEEYGVEVSHYQKPSSNRKKSRGVFQGGLGNDVILSIARGFYVPNGVQLIGRFYRLTSCIRSCATSSTCFAGDYDPSTRKCYHHAALTTCDTYRSHPLLTHFSKVPCRITDASNGRIDLGVSMAGGRKERGVYSLQGCLKRCAAKGAGTRAATVDMAATGSGCLALDFDFATCRCYLFVSNPLVHCPLAATPDNAPANLRHNPSVIHISFCPGPTTTTPTKRAEGTTIVIIGP